MGVAALETKRAQLVAEATALSAKEERTDDDEKRIVAIIGEAKSLREQIATERELETLAGEQRDYDQPARRLGAQRAADGAEPNDGEPKRDRRSPGRRFIASDKIKMIQAGARGRQFGVEFDGLLRQENPDDALEERAIVYSGTPSGSMLLPQVVPTIYRPAETPLTMRDVLAGFTTNSDAVVVMTETSYTNNAVEVAEATDISGAGFTAAAKPQSTLAFSETSFPIQTIAHWVPITRQTLDDLPQLESYINDRLIVGLKRRENLEFLSGNGTAPNIKGLLSTSGIQALDGTYFTANPVRDAAAANENLNRVLRAIQKIAWTGLANATFISMNPTDYEMFLTTTNTQKNYLFGGPSAGRVATLWGLPVVQEPNVTAGTVVVGDGTMAAVVDRQQAAIYVADQHADYFTHNIIVILAEERVGLVVYRPVAFANVTLAAWA